MATQRRYWLFKSEPGSYSFEQFARDRRTFWSGVRNHQVDVVDRVVHESLFDPICQPARIESILKGAIAIVVEAHLVMMRRHASEVHVLRG